jgi:YVTN family beta-propeller protein
MSTSIDEAPVAIAAAVGLLAAIVLGCAGARPGGAPPPSAAVVARIPIRTFATGVTITPDASRAYVSTSAEVIAIDAAQRTVAATFELGNVPYQTALSPDGRRGYVVDLLQQLVWFLDLPSGTVANKIWLGHPGTPVLRPGIAVAPDGSRVYVSISAPTGAAEDSLRVFDAATGQETNRPLDFHPGQIALSRDGRRLWVTGCHGLCSDGVVHVLDPASFAKLAEVTLPSVPGGIALSPDGMTAWIANGLAGSVSAVDLGSQSVVATVGVDAEPLGVATSPDGSRVWVTCFATGTLVAIDPATRAVVARGGVGPSPRAIDLTPDGRSAWLTHSDAYVSVVDLSRIPPR